uniref:CLIP domain-containing protein n=1 Tax=Anopheles albimanus TaxID=7167 RepID=A0A182FZD3_ANOAL
MKLCYGIVAIVAPFMLPMVAWGLACKLPGNTTGSCIPLNECSTWQGFGSKNIVSNQEYARFDSVVRACQNVENIVCCA